MPLKAGVPNRSRAEIEAWILAQVAADPSLRARLQADPKGTVEQLIGVRPPDWLSLTVVSPSTRRGPAAPPPEESETSAVLVLPR